MVAIATTEPERIQAGLDVSWTKSLSDFDPATDTLVYALAKDDGTDDAVVTVGDNGDGSFIASMADTVTVDMDPGGWLWRASVTDGSGIKWPVGEGRVDVVAAPASGTDVRTWAKKALDDIEAVLSGTAARSRIAGYSINNRSASYAQRADLYTERARLADIVRAEENDDRLRAGLGNRNRIISRFD